MDQQTMQCMEVWGGNQAVDCGVAMAGVDAWVLSRPVGNAAGGGDVHYVSSCATGRVTRLLLADVSGHGAGVANAASFLRGLMRRYVNFIDPTRFVRTMNETFAADGRHDGFATAIVTTFFAPTGSLSVCNAGHPPPLHYQARTRNWRFLEFETVGGHGPSNIPLGVLARAEYQQAQMRLAVGDLVLCYTDALTEARVADGGLLGTDGLLELVRTLETSDPPAIIPALMARLRERGGSGVFDDDLTILLFRPNGLFPRLPLSRRLAAPFRVLGGVLRSLRSGGGPMPWPEWSVANIGGALLDRLNGSRSEPTSPPKQ